MPSVFDFTRIRWVPGGSGILCLLWLTTSALAQATNVLSAFGTANVDGRFSPMEWDNAGKVDLAVNLPEGGSTPGRLYVMNDRTNLYLSVRLERSLVDTATVGFYFNNGDGGTGLAAGDDAIVFDVFSGTDHEFFDLFYYTNSPCPPFNICSDYDANAGGSNDGDGGFSNDGTYSYFELSHPLNSGDPHDFSLAPGQTVLCWPFVRLLNSTNYADTNPDGVTILVAPSPNRPPTARMTIFPIPVSLDSANPALIALGSAGAAVVLNGSSSTDAEGDPLTYRWYDGQQEIGVASIFTNTFKLGVHVSTLAVSDGLDTGVTNLIFNVITPDQAVQGLISEVGSSALAPRSQRPLLAILEAARASFQRGHLAPGTMALRAFEFQVRAHPLSQVLAQRLSDAAQQIIEALMQERSLQEARKFWPESGRRLEGFVRQPREEER